MPGALKPLHRPGLDPGDVERREARHIMTTRGSVLGAGFESEGKARLDTHLVREARGFVGLHPANESPARGRLDDWWAMGRSIRTPVSA